MESRVGPGHSSRTPSAGPRRVRAAILSLALGGAAALGSYAALGHLEVGPDEQVAQASNASLAARAAQLDAMEADLRAALAKDVPKLPPIPKYAKVKIPRVAAPQIIAVSYVPNVKYKKDKDYEKKQREAEKKRREQQREAEKKRREEQREAEKKRREEQKKH